MEVKRFFSASMQDVLRMVREELGPDAVILSNTKVDGGIEVVAALDYEEEWAQEDVDAQVVSHGEPSPSQLARMHAEKHMRLQKEMDSARKRIEGVRAKRQKESVKRDHESRTDDAMNNSHSGAPADHEDKGFYDKASPAWSELSDMRAQIMEIKGLINSQPKAIDTHLSDRAQSIAGQQVEKTLESLCLSRSIKKMLMKRIECETNYEAAWSKVRQEIESSIQGEQEDIIDRGGVISLVGPTGSGKTMTIGKIAARYVMKYGAESIALVTTDRYRIAAHEQLKVFGRILNVPVHTVDESNCLDTILNKLSHKKLILVDTAGLMHSDACWSEQLQELKMSSHQIKNYLVVSSVGQYQVMCSNFHNYKVVGLSGAIITKVDEAVSLGEVLSFLIDTRLKAGYFTDGQRVPEDIHLFNSHDIFERAQLLLNSSERWVSISSSESDVNSTAMMFHSA